MGSLALAAGALPDDAAAWVILAIVLGTRPASATLALVAAVGGAPHRLRVRRVRPIRAFDAAAESAAASRHGCSR